MTVTVIKGSLLEAKTEAIVNPANSFLRHGAGLARVIVDAAAPRTRPGPQNATNGPQRGASAAWWQEQYQHPSIPIGGVGVTSAGRLPYKGIIHAVGPIWGSGRYYEYELLKLVYRNAIQAMRARGWRSIAFPAISSGLFGVPIEVVANGAMAGLWAEHTFESDEVVEVRLLSDEHVEAFLSEYELYAEPR